MGNLMLIQKIQEKNCRLLKYCLSDDSLIDAHRDHKKSKIEQYPIAEKRRSYEVQNRRQQRYI